jgi:hypothetical protein
MALAATDPTIACILLLSLLGTGCFPLYIVLVICDNRADATFEPQSHYHGETYTNVVKHSLLQRMTKYALLHLRVNIDWSLLHERICNRVSAFKISCGHTVEEVFVLNVLVLIEEGSQS